MHFLKARIIILAIAVVVSFLMIFLVAGFKAASKSKSYLPPDILSFIDASPSDPIEINLQTRWYNIIVDQKGRIAVKTPDNKIIIRSLSYYAELDSEKAICGLKNVSVRLINDSTVEIKGTGPKNTSNDLVLISNKSLPKIDVRSKIHYTTNTLIRREALVALFAVPVSEVYLKNRTAESSNFEPEYWLEKEGVRFGHGRQSAMIYHTPALSSLQIETGKKLLFFNLDYSLDHPFVKLPFQQDAGKRWIDLSESDFEKGYELNDSFSINVGEYPCIIPRLMMVPFGYKAGYVFTEHADNGDIAKQRAAYFGSEDITDAAKATGGFVAHKIPVTKSVFYTGPITSPGASIFEGGQISPLLHFLDQLNATNLYDICMHTPENATSDRNTLKKSVKFMKERYNTISWIDHGFYGGKLNRESMVCDGLDSLSQFYVADLWKKYETKYFWSAAVEMIKNRDWVSVTTQLKNLHFYNAYVTFLQHYLSPKDLRKLNLLQAFHKIKTNYSYRLEMNTLETNCGEAQPTPLYWQHPTRTQQFYSWATDQEKNYGELTEKDVENERAQLSKLIKNQGIFIDHGYFVRNRSDDRILKNVNGKLVINPKFDAILSILSKSEQNQDLYLTTIKNLLDYWILLDHVQFQYNLDGTMDVINNNNECIKGLSLIIKSKNVLCDGTAPAMKRSGDETIFWCDVPAHNKIVLSF